MRYPKQKMSAIVLAYVSLFAALTAVGAFMRIPIPYVPFTLQILFVYLAGSLMGSRLGGFSQFIYLAMGLIGVPIFTEGGGPMYIFKPTFGYLIGFMIAAFVIGKIIEKQPKPQRRHFYIAHFIGLFIVYLFGVTHLYVSLNLWLGIPTSMSHVFLYGFILAVPGDIVLCIVASSLASRLHQRFPLTKRLRKDVQAA
ncbi:MAG TPA: biotin transporter BioY [Bacillota bacterium]